MTLTASSKIPPNSRVCLNCDHYRPIPDNEELGTCHESSPTALVKAYKNISETDSTTKQIVTGLVAVSIDGFWPPTRFDKDCGKFSKKRSG